MRDAPPAPTHDGAILSAAIKAVRKHRGLSVGEVAAAMHMPVRTYERFEAGATRFNLDHVHRFAAAARCDPQAICLAVATGSPELARRCADNQLGTILTIALQQFDERLGDRIQSIDARRLVAAVVDMFETLAAEQEAGDPARDWLEAGVDGLRARRPRPGR